MLDIYLMKRPNRIFTSTPYHPEFSAEAKDLNGSWVGGPIWSFSPKAEEDVRKLMFEFFGTDDLQTARTVSALIALGEVPEISPLDTDVFLFGRPIVSRKRASSDIRLGDRDTIEVVQGTFPRRSKSRTTSTLDFTSDTVLKVSRVPVDHRDLQLPGVTSEPEPFDNEALSALERELMQRLAIVRAARST